MTMTAPMARAPAERGSVMIAMPGRCAGSARLRGGARGGRLAEDLARSARRLRRVAVGCSTDVGARFRLVPVSVGVRLLPRPRVSDHLVELRVPRLPVELAARAPGARDENRR